MSIPQDPLRNFTIRPIPERIDEKSPHEIRKSESLYNKLPKLKSAKTLLTTSVSKKSLNAPSQELQGIDSVFEKITISDSQCIIGEKLKNKEYETYINEKLKSTDKNTLKSSIKCNDIEIQNISKISNFILGCAKCGIEFTMEDQEQILKKMNSNWGMKNKKIESIQEGCNFKMTRSF